METILTQKERDHLMLKNKEFEVEGLLVGQGSLSPKFLMIGEAPGEVEVETGIPFTSRSGKELDSFLESIGITREEIYITSSFKSRPLKYKEKTDKKSGEIFLKKYNRTPTKREIYAHAPVLDQEIERLNPPLIVTIGNIGLQRLVDKKAKISDYHGTVYEGPLYRTDKEKDLAYERTEKNYRVFATYHPAAVLYQRSLEATINEDYQKLKNILQEAE